jgi:ATP-dependent Clp protease ATP-binding subunit ClpA
MFERFTDDARRVIVRAQEISRRLGHRHIGTGHLLAALAQEGSTAQLLTAAGASEPVVLDELRSRRRPHRRAVSGHMPFSDATKHTLEGSLVQTHRRGHALIGPPHLLLALLEQDGLAVEMLAGLPVDVVELRAAAERLADREAGPGGSAGDSSGDSSGATAP